MCWTCGANEERKVSYTANFGRENSTKKTTGET
jgi:hypothetical protein